GDDRLVREDRLRRVSGERPGHETDLDDRAQSQRQHPVVDPVDPAEVVHRPPGDLSVDTEFVVQDRVRAYRAYAQFLMGHPQGRGELFADVAASRTGAVV